jgi:hypothetical protein
MNRPAATIRRATQNCVAGLLMEVRQGAAETYLFFFVAFFLVAFFFVAFFFVAFFFAIWQFLSAATTFDASATRQDCPRFLASGRSSWTTRDFRLLRRSSGQHDQLRTRIVCSVLSGCSPPRYSGEAYAYRTPHTPSEQEDH